MKTWPDAENAPLLGAHANLPAAVFRNLANLIARWRVLAFHECRAAADARRLRAHSSIRDGCRKDAPSRAR
jgi:hypothetical protein